MRCDFPGCNLEVHFEGEHRFGRPDRPRGSLRFLQSLGGNGNPALNTPCDLCYAGHVYPIANFGRAEGFYADMLGFGWALCSACLQKHQEEVIQLYAGQNWFRGDSSPKRSTCES